MYALQELIDEEMILTLMIWVKTNYKGGISEFTVTGHLLFIDTQHTLKVVAILSPL